MYLPINCLTGKDAGQTGDGRRKTAVVNDLLLRAQAISYGSGGSHFGLWQRVSSPTQHVLLLDPTYFFTAGTNSDFHLLQSCIAAARAEKLGGLLQLTSRYKEQRNADHACLKKPSGSL